MKPRSKAAEYATQSVDLPRFRPVLLGTAGPEDAPRALVQLPGGRRLRLAVGDPLAGGVVAAIAPGRLGIRRGNRVHWLKLPAPPA